MTPKHPRLIVSLKPVRISLFSDISGKHFFLKSDNKGELSETSDAVESDKNLVVPDKNPAGK